MAFSNTIAFFIILTTAAVLYAGGVTDIQTAADAANALRPLAGELTFALFALGIIGTGLLAIPVLAGSAAYGVADAFGWKASAFGNAVATSMLFRSSVRSVSENALIPS